jgi:deoxyribose-phosphate aldolase
MKIDLKNDVGSILDHTILKLDATETDIATACDEAVQYGFNSVCVRPKFVKFARNRLMWSSVAVCAAIGFENIEEGYTPLYIKESEIFKSLYDGAIEFDVTMNLHAMNNGRE